MLALIVAQESQGELFALAVVLSLACLGGAWWARTQAPAVCVALVTGWTSGLIAFLIASAHGPRNVPLVVLMVASVGLTMSGLLYLMLQPRLESAASVRRAGLIVLAAAPVAGLAVLLSVQHACPLYVTQGAGYCYYVDDVLGGWSSAAAVIVSLNLLVVGGLLLLTERGRVRAAEATRVTMALL